MRKNLFLLLIAVMAAIHVCAQEVEIATLQNGDDVQLFFGHDAFIDAMDAAESGGVITLSPGRFNATDITKPVTIYGSGYETKADSLSVAEGKALYPTILYGDLDISLDSLQQQTNHLYVEGIYFNGDILNVRYLRNATFIKCLFSSRIGSNVESYNNFITQCRISYLSPSHFCTLNISNSIIKYIYGSSTNLLIQNSLIFKGESLLATLKNSIMLINASINEKCSFYNCMLPKGSGPDLQGNWREEKISKILFGRDEISYNDTSTYELTEDAKKIYLGTDGTQIGIYGGSQPFSTKLTIPRVVKRNIADKTEAETESEYRSGIRR